MTRRPPRSTLFPYTTSSDLSGRLSRYQNPLINIGERIIQIFFALGVMIRTTDRKSTRLNSSHSQNSYAVCCLKKNIYNVKTTPPCVPLFARSCQLSQCVPSV